MNRYFQEVRDAHALIRDCLGDAHTQDTVCDALVARFCPAFSMVTPRGAIMDFTAVDNLFRTQRGARAGLTIAIEDLQLIAESDTGATVTYKERQIIPDQGETLRFATAVFETGADGRVMWRHLHETWL
jgi:hypothetical protein